MSTLLSLPTEIISRIIALTIPSGFEPVMMTCKHLHAAGEVHREKHNRLAKRFRNFTFGVDISSSWDLLLVIAAEPLVAHYIESAYLYNDARWGFPDKHGEFEESRLSPKDTDHTTMTSLLQHSEILESANIDRDEWLRFMLEGEPQRPEDRLLYSTVFLLSLLPNITTLGLPKVWQSFYDESATQSMLRNVLFQILQRANAYPHRDAPLSKLSNLYPCGVSHGYDDRMGLQSLSYFMDLPSFRTLTAVSCIASDDANSGIDFRWPISEGHSRVEVVELYASILEGPDTEIFLSRLANLRCFRFSFENKWHGCGHEWGVEQLVDSLQKSVGSSLKELSISLTTYFLDEVQGRVTNFRGFTALEDLEVDVRLFDDPSNDVSSSEMEEDPEKQSRLANIPGLAEILPSSIKTVRLITGVSAAETKLLKEWFAGFQTAANRALPNLKKIVVTRGTTRVGLTQCEKSQDAEAWSEVQKLAQEQGCVYREVPNANAEWVSSLFQRFRYLDS